MVLLVRTVLKPSSIQGLGVFADQDIKQGTVVWAYMEPVDQTFTPEELIVMPSIAREFLLKYAYYHIKTGRYVHSGDNGRFVNHSDTPNTIGHYPEGCTEGEDIAARDIARGEELTCNYFTFDAEANIKLSQPL